MPPTLHVVRHAEGYHNVAKDGENIHDPFLTDKGAEQCRNLCEHFKYHETIDLLLASPMKRTIQTCQISFKPVVERDPPIKIMLMPLAQESSDTPMDTGSATEELKEAFGDLIDGSRIDEIYPHWNKNIGKFSTDPKEQIRRARDLRKFIMDRPEKSIVLVTHGSFAHAITGNFTDEGVQTTRMWENAECRTYTFDESSGDEAKIVETKESIGRRPSLSIPKEDMTADP